MKQIILDTNFLVYCAEKKIDYASGLMAISGKGYELVVPSLVVRELKELAEKAEKYSDRKAASLAVKLLDHNKIKVVEIMGKTTDQAIVDVSQGNIVATLDFRLRKELKGKAKVIVINSHKEIDLA